jgi:hypothetical protein
LLSPDSVATVKIRGFAGILASTGNRSRGSSRRVLSAHVTLAIDRQGKVRGAVASNGPKTASMASVVSRRTAWGRESWSANLANRAQILRAPVETKIVSPGSGSRGAAAERSATPAYSSRNPGPVKSLAPRTATWLPFHQPPRSP